MIQALKDYRAISRSKKTLKRAIKLYRQKHKTLDPKARERVEALIEDLQTSILQKRAGDAKSAAWKIEEEAGRLMPRSSWDKLRDFVGSIAFALLVAIVIRQTWFEFYSIPTGSMRPTCKEGDYLVVSKTDYGINTPLRSGHFYFDPDLVERGSIIVFTGENMDMPDDNTMYFYVIPGKKQYIKRLIGKPGDTLYFYGGQIYGIDASGNELTELRDPLYFSGLEHIPFIRFEGKVETPSAPNQGFYPNAVFYQMNEPIAKLNINSIGGVSGETIPKNKHYSDFWGFKNFAMTRLLTGEQASQLHPKLVEDIEPGLLYLEINHHPSIQGAHLIRDEMGRLRPGLGTSISLLPLSQEHLDEILAHMTTARFEVKKGRVYRFGSGSGNESIRPELAGVPDGVYEFQDGKADRVLFGRISKSLSSDHPLLRHTAKQIQTLYNLGFEWLTYFNPAPNSPLPSRYAYFRDGDLYLMGGSVLKKNDPALETFLKRERQKQAISTSVKPYFPFEDSGPPRNSDGTLNAGFIQKYGVKVPEGMILAMGDNHAMSADTRHFGFVPLENLRGGASFLFWPAGERWGRYPQPTIRHLTVPNVTVLSAAAVIGALSYLWIRRRYYRPLRKKNSVVE